MMSIRRWLPIAVVLIVMGCDRSSSRQDERSPTASASVVPASSASSTVVVDAGIDSGASADAGLPRGAAASDAIVPLGATVHLLIERVMTHNGQTPDHFFAFDLLVLVEAPNAKPVRVQPFCPPAKRDAFEVCKAFRKCHAADAGTDDAVVCDGKSFVIVQHDGATYLKTEEAEILVRPDTPAIRPPTRRDRLAFVDL
jgi:hypothetical protein